MKYHKNSVVISENMMTLEKAEICTFRGEAIKATPKMRVTFMKHAPMMLPNAKSKCPFCVEVMLFTNSGTLVPKETMVAPME